MKNLSAFFRSLIRSIFRIRVIFEDGTWIEFLNREAVLYGEPDGHRMEITWYFKPGRMRDRVLYSRDMKRWNIPYELEEVLPEKQIQIRQKLVRYCQRKRILLEIKES